MPAPRFQHGFADDVFISYTHEDDREEAGIRWVTKFEAELKHRLAKVSGHSINSWRDDKLTGADRFGPEIEQQLDPILGQYGSASRLEVAGARLPSRRDYAVVLRDRTLQRLHLVHDQTVRITS